MKISIFMISSFLLTLPVSASSEQAFKVLLRKNKTNKTYFAMMKLPHLESSNSFDGKYFKITLGKNNDAISFDSENEQIKFKAATVYYHLNQARDFWIQKMKSDVALKHPKITVRLDLTNQFDELGHFGHDNRIPQYNNALSIPAGSTPEWVPEDKQDKWGKEIWFRPMKKILTKSIAPAGPNPITSGLLAMKKPLINYTRGQFTVNLMERLFYPSYVTTSVEQEVIRFFGSFALLHVMIEGSKQMDSLFLEKYYYLDTAMVPEIAYHEYAHLILSDRLELSHSTPVNEGMADYFAAVQSGKKKIYAKVSGFSNASSKNTQEKKKYSHWDEANRNATADFTLSVLWDVRETLGDDIGDKVVYEARSFLTTKSSTISDGLLRALLKACEIKCEDPKRDKLRLYETFTWKGF